MPIILLLVIIVACVIFISKKVKEDIETLSSKEPLLSSYSSSSPLTQPTAGIPRWPYVKKTYLMNHTEYQFFRALRQALGNEYLIFAQVHLSKLVDVPSGQRQWQTFWNKIDRKSVDFVLCEPAGVKPVLAIEVDGAGHWMKDRTNRDQFVKQVFEQAGLKFIRFDARSTYNLEELRTKLMAKLASN